MKEHCNTPSSTTRLTSCLHSILQCWLLSVLTHGNQSALQNGMELACKTTLQHTHASHSHAHTQTKWEQSTDKKIERNTVQRRMEGLLRKQQFSLEERREKWATIGMFNLLFLCTKYWIPIITNQFIAKFKNITMDQLNTSCDKREKEGIIPMAYPEKLFLTSSLLQTTNLDAVRGGAVYGRDGWPAGDSPGATG